MSGSAGLAPRAAALFCAAALLLWGWTLARALAPVRAPRIPAQVSAAAPRVAASHVRTGSAEDIAMVAANDPFSPERGAAPTPPPATQAVAQAADVRPLRLVGTVLLARGASFALCQLGDAAPRLVHIGEKLGPLTLKAVAAGRATFASAEGGTTVLTVPKPGS